MKDAYRSLYDRLNAELEEFECWLRKQPFETILSRAAELDLMWDVLYAVENLIAEEDENNPNLDVLLEEEYGLTDLVECARNRLNRDTLPIIMDAICDETDRGWLNR